MKNKKCTLHDIGCSIWDQYGTTVQDEIWAGDCLHYCPYCGSKLVDETKESALDKVIVDKLATSWIPAMKEIRDRLNRLEEK